MKIEIPDFSQGRVLVVGDVMLDRYWYGDALRISPEAPVPVVHIGSANELPGGAANVAVNISALEGKVTLLGLVGEDDAGTILQRQLEQMQVESCFLKIPNVPTISKLRIIGRNQQLIRLDFEEKFTFDVPELLTLYRAKIAMTDVVILSDYGKGTLRYAEEFIRIAQELNVPVLVDPKSKDFNLYRGSTIITPNLNEFEAVVGKCENEEELVAKARNIIEQYDLTALLITRGSGGMSLVDREGVEHFPAHAREVYDVTGAGDTAIATLGIALACGEDLTTAVMFANLAAGIVVQKLGVATASVTELRRAMQRQQDPWAGILTEKQLLQEVAAARSMGETIVMTNGCFDILHAGHVSYLEEAKVLGRRLIVAINDDNSVKSIKGPMRPLNGIEQRMLIVAALRAVDWVVPFSEDTPERLIKAVKPDILVKAGDYEVEEIAGSQYVLSYGGRVEIMSYEEGFSTTALIDKIKNSKGALSGE